MSDPYTGFVTIAGDQFVLADDPSRIVKLKGSNFQTVETPWAATSHWNEPAINRTLDLCAGMGCNCLRVCIHVDRPEEWGRWDELKNKAARLGMRMYPFFEYGDRFAPADSESYAADHKALVEIVRRYADDPSILAWDVINEPEWISRPKYQWRFEEETGKRRMNWLLRLVDAIHENDSQHPVTIGFIFNYTWWTPDWARVLMGRCDFIDFHYYHRTYQARGVDTAIREVRAETAKPIVMGEFGQSSDPTYSTGHEEVHSEETQRQLYAHAMESVREAGIVGCLQWSTCSHNDCPREEGENEYGIHRQDYSPKPAAHVFRDGMAVPRFA